MSQPANSWVPRWLRPRQATTTYVPGACNIGPAEIARRRRSGWAGVLATAVAWVALATLDAQPVWLLLLSIPATIAAAGFLQASQRFCVYFGLAALFNVDREAGNTTPVVEAEARAKDRKQVWRLLAASAAIGLAVALLAYGL